MVRSKTSPKETLNGTVRLLKQSLQLMLAMVIVGLGLIIWIDYPIGLIIAGVGLFAIGGTILEFRRLIWDSYQKDFRSSDNNGLSRLLLTPSIWSYRINIYGVWPAVMAIGVALVLVGVFTRL